MEIDYNTERAIDKTDFSCVNNYEIDRLNGGGRSVKCKLVSLFLIPSESLRESQPYLITLAMQCSVFSKPWASIKLRHLLLDKIVMSFRQV